MKNTSRNDKAANRYSSLKWLLCVSLFVNMVMDMAVFVWLLCAQAELRFWLIPLIAAAIDCVVLVLSLASNFRLRYGLAIILPYLFVTLGLMCLMAANNFMSSAMTFWAQISWCVVHTLSLLLVIAGYATAVRDGTQTKKAWVIVLATVTALFAAAVTLGSLGFLDRGYFGQGREDVVRPLVYEYDPNLDGYNVVSVMEGKGNKAVLTDTFNDKPVLSVYGGIFSEKGVDTVAFSGEVKFDFTDTDLFAKADPNIKIIAEKDNIDDVRNLLYGYNTTGSFALANKVLPSGLSDGDVYITFSYSLDSYRRFDGQVLETWFGSKGDVFNVDEYAQKYDFFEKSDITSDDDLDWNYVNSEGYIFNGLKVNGKSIEGQPVTESMEQVELSFAKIYRVYVNEDNDGGSYAIPKSFANSAPQTAGECEFRYLVEATADDWLGGLTRNGFDISWSVADGKDAASHSLTQAFSQELSQQVHSDVYLTPQWTMRKPTIRSVTTDCANNTVMYGEKIAFSSDAVAADENFTLTYKWTWDGTDTGGEAWSDKTQDAFLFEHVFFKQGGTYTCTVTSHSADSDLTSFSSDEVRVTVTKRKVTVNWAEDGTVNKLQNVITYNGQEQTYTLSFDEGNVINDDELDWAIENSAGSFNQATKRATQAVLRNAGNYNITLSLTGEQANQYEIVQGAAKTVYIAKAQLTPVWDDKGGESGGSVAYSYDKQQHSPEATVTGLGEDNHSLQISHSRSGSLHNGSGFDASEQQPTNAGTYTVEISLTEAQDLNNYTLTETTRNFTIKQIELTLSWDSKESYVYNGKLQQPSVSKAEGSFEEDLDDIVENGLTVTLSTQQSGLDGHFGVYAGKYTATAALNDTSLYNNNYALSNGASEDFEIGKRHISVTWNKNSFVYNGEYQHPEVNSVTDAESDGESGVDLPGKANHFTYTGAQRNVQSGYTVTAHLTDGEERFATNFTINDADYSFEIIQATATVVWDTVTFTYDGQSHIPQVHCDGVAADGRLEITVTPDSNKDVNTYQATVALTKAIDKQNYKLEETSTSHSFTITQREVTLVWNSGTLTYNGEKQAPAIDSVNNAVASERVALLSQLNANRVYEATNAGNEYSVSTSLSDDGDNHFATNYTIKAGDETHTYDIAKYKLTVSWSAQLMFTYNHQQQHPEESVSGVKAEKPVLSVTYSGNRGDISPLNADVYTATAVLTGDDVNKNYEIVAGSTCQFTISAQTVSVVWEQSKEFTYDGDTHYIKVIEVSGDVESDPVPVEQLTYTATDSKNVGSYPITVSLPTSGNYNINYVIDDPSSKFVINPATVAVVWGDDTFTYDGDRHTVKASVTGVKSEQPLLSCSIEGGSEYAVNAGEYTVTASLTDADVNKNYKLENVTHSLTIDKMELTVTWTDVDYTYKAESIVPTVTLSKAANEEIPVIVCTVSGDNLTNGNAVNVGSYSVTVALTDADVNKNYELSGELKKEFSITKRTVTAVWSQDELTYNGQEQHPVVQSFTGDVPQGIPLSAVTYDGAETDAGSGYHVTAQLSEQYSSNYALNDADKEFAIAKATLTVSWSEQTSFTYNGEKQAPQPSFSGQIDGEEPTLKVTYKLKDGDADVAPVNAGSYVATAVLEEDAVNPVNKNYDLQGTLTCDFTISEVELTVTVTLTDHGEYKTRPAIDDLAGKLGYEQQGLVAGQEIEITYKYVSDEEQDDGYLQVTAEVSVKSGETDVTENYKITVKNAVVELQTPVEQLPTAIREEQYAL